MTHDTTTSSTPSLPEDPQHSLPDIGPALPEDPAATEIPAGDPPRSSRRWWVGLLVLVLLGMGAYLFVTHQGTAPSGSPTRGQTAGPRPLPVTAVPAKVGDLNVYLTGLGAVTPLNTITVKSRVDGQLMQVPFREGQIVKTGDVLAEIDPRPFEVQLTQAEGQMARDQALLKNAQLDLQRYRVLVAQDSIAKQQMDTQESLIRQYEGAVKVDQGLIDSAKLQLLYCHITAPIGGRVGLRLVDPGNIVHATDTTGLVVITQLQPVAVVFAIAEDSLPAVLAKLTAGESLPVEAYDREQRQKLAVGSLLTVNNQIDPTTGTVRLKAVFPNTDNALFPNQFVNARLLLEVKRGATVVPAAAIQRSPQGAFVYVVKADQTAAMRPVTIGVSQGDATAISAGLVLGDLVVTDGVERLRDGVPVEVQKPAAKSPQKGS
jgi:membrane fusion protein, multidrug efflux system